MFKKKRENCEYKKICSFACIMKVYNLFLNVLRIMTLFFMNTFFMYNDKSFNCFCCVKERSVELIIVKWNSVKINRVSCFLRESILNCIHKFIRRHICMYYVIISLSFLIEFGTYVAFAIETSVLFRRAFLCLYNIESIIWWKNFCKKIGLCDRCIEQSDVFNGSTSPKIPSIKYINT